MSATSTASLTTPPNQMTRCEINAQITSLTPITTSRTAPASGKTSAQARITSLRVELTALGTSYGPRDFTRFPNGALIRCVPSGTATFVASPSGSISSGARVSGALIAAAASAPRLSGATASAPLVAAASAPRISGASISAPRVSGPAAQPYLFPPIATSTQVPLTAEISALLTSLDTKTTTIATLASRLKSAGVTLKAAM